MDGLALTPGVGGDFITLSRAGTGVRVRKHILSTGTLHYKGRKVNIDRNFLSTVKRNFDSGISIVQVPMVNNANQHTEDPRANVGQVVDVELSGDKLYAVMDIRDEDAAKRVENKLLLGASALLHLNYEDTRDGQRKGPSLLHVAVTNRPHELDLEEYEVLAMSADSAERAVLLTSAPTKENPMDLDDILALLREEHGIDVPELQRAAADAEAVAALSNTLRDALNTSDLVSLSAEDEVSGEELVAAVTTLVEGHVALSNEIAETKETARVAAAEARIDGLVKDGFITPAKRDANLKLLLSNEETFEELLPVEPVLRLSQEEGFEPLDPTPGEVLDQEVTRYAEAAKAAGITLS